MSFKTFDLAHDVASITSAVNEVVTISSSLFIPGVGDVNVKTYQNIASSSAGPALGGYWQTIFDSSPASIQSTALFDVTFGMNTASAYYALAAANPSGCANEKVKIYGELASLLLGDAGSTFTVSGTAVNECFFIMVKRGIMKDELKKGVTTLIMSGAYDGVITASDVGASTAYKQTAGGDYAPLLSETSELGQVWYNSGIIVVPALLISEPWVNGAGQTSGAWSGSNPDGASLTGALTGSTIDNLVSGFRNSIANIAFQNQTNLYSTIYFCRATNTEFNYSSNPSYLDNSQRIIVTSGSNVLQSRTYITKVGLYDANDNLLAVGSVNMPIMKAPDTESILRIRLDY